MILTNLTASLGLTAIQTPTRAAVSGANTLGLNSVIKYPINDSALFYRRLKLFGLDASGFLDWTTSVGASADSHVPAVAQVETATAVGTITQSGNAIVTVTAADLAGSPLAIPFAVLDDDTPAQWAAKARAALAANAAISALYTPGGSTTAISLTRILADEYGHANDTTLNIALANGTCTGITADATSDSTLAGDVATGGYWDQVGSLDAEGLNLPIGSACALILQNVKGSALYEAALVITGTLPLGAMALHAAQPATGLAIFGNVEITSNHEGMTEIIVGVLINNIEYNS